MEIKLPRKKDRFNLPEDFYVEDVIGYNQAVDDFTAYIKGQKSKLTEIVEENYYCDYDEKLCPGIATAIIRHLTGDKKGE